MKESLFLSFFLSFSLSLFLSKLELFIGFYGMVELRVPTLGAWVSGSGFGVEAANILG